MKRLGPRLLAVLLLLSLHSFAQDGDGLLKFASLGDFKLVSGESIRDCRIGYRAFGHLNAAKSNVILFTTWATGTTEMLRGQVGGRERDMQFRPRHYGPTQTHAAMTYPDMHFGVGSRQAKAVHNQNVHGDNL